MEYSKYTYLILLICSITAPLALSFDGKVRYYSKLKYVGPAILITAIVFWFWDVRFTSKQVWSFNSEFVLGINILGMPIEEWLFFIVIPYCCVFIYEVLNYYLKSFEHPRLFGVISMLLVLIFLFVSISFRQQDYTFLTFLLCSIVLFLNTIRVRFKPFVSKFYLSYLISLLPFVVVNGILTSMPVVKYNQAHIINLHLWTIPVEDFSYFFLLHLMVISLYEFLKDKRWF
jgi:lycopene cyclase domain-containing protein